MQVGDGSSEVVPRAGDQHPFRVYKPCNTSIQIPNLPDDYYNPTTADLKDAQATLTARTQALVNAPLQTRTMRESTERAKQDKWPSTTIRIRFPDRTQLEKVFPSSDKIKSVYAFVRGCLNEEAIPVKFILYQSPPKRDLKVSDPKIRGLSLVELQLAPSSILLLRFESEKFNSTTVAPPLAPSILARATDIPTPQTHETSTQHGRLPESDQTQRREVPKWFKLGIKK
ncbi:hypothetical protein AX15_006911 [Amanita polypyramis BW_CC]|nr:hypothetical protein AX15_006911 [Amanita polypyramis BW_CC]